MTNEEAYDEIVIDGATCQLVYTEIIMDATSLTKAANALLKAADDLPLTEDNAIYVVLQIVTDMVDCYGLTDLTTANNGYPDLPYWIEK